ncbi:hypothetical protein I4U23_021717 [Adineta vaga]|nr:hypothetical protein I4U23_021717 [Adineta vaga]
MSGNKGSALSKIFGGTGKSGTKLRDAEDVLNKKVEHYLEAKINEETAIARRNARTNKHNALNALKRKKRLEKTLQQVEQHELSNEMAHIDLPTVSAQIRTYAQPVAPSAELAEWVS